LGQRYIDEIAREWRAIHLSFVIDRAPRDQ